MRQNVPPIWRCAPERCLPVRRFWILVEQKMVLPPERIQTQTENSRFVPCQFLIMENMILHELGRKGVDSGTGDSAVHDLSDGFRQFVCDAEVCAGAGQLVGEGGFLEAPDIHVCC